MTLRVAEIWRYPVKSMQGERVQSAAVGPKGLAGDRAYALVDVATGFGLTARRAPGLLFATARLRDDSVVEITLPDGSVAGDDETLSAWLGRRVVLRRAGEGTIPRYEGVADDEHDSGWEPYDGARGTFHDSAEVMVSMVSTTTTAGWDRRRFRANLWLDGEGEDALVGSRVRVGDSTLDVRAMIPRCVMVTRPQPGGIDKDLDVLRTIHRQRDGHLAVGAVVAAPGTIRVGDALVAA